MDPEEVKSLDSNGAGKKSENNSSNSDIVHVEKEEIPEGAEEVARAASGLPTKEPQEALPGAPAPLLPHITATSLLQTREPDPEVITVEEVSLVPSLFVELSEEEVRAAIMEPHEVDEGVPPSLLREKEAPVRKERLSRECPPAQEVKAFSVPEGKSITLFGGAAAVALLAVAVGVALALRRKQWLFQKRKKMKRV
ncbi:Bcl-2-like protein 13 [Heterocephalus glaber]|uniref:Bcl-2-like protein 13 n=1 Tax=Heterocephalus glaber TaxID=10181 RepID=G5AKR9_HETGA|nr:Bcl-2-like protein 13 [Heterocephalus glaber]